ncbi:hypothetical protein [Candidatus Endowatersipora endosymbiont of Watersipora subatra]
MLLIISIIVIYKKRILMLKSLEEDRSKSNP